MGVSVHGVSVQGVSEGVSVQGVSVQKGSLFRGVSVQGVSVRETHPDRDPPYGNKRVVRILLECILVLNVFYVDTCTVTNLMFYFDLVFINPH